MNRSESGSALVIALAALAVVATAVMIIALHIEATQLAARHDSRRAVLDALVDAAFAEALAELAADPTFRGRGLHPFAHGGIESSVRPNGPDSRSVVATASYRGWVASIAAEVELGDGPRVVWARRTQRFAASR